MQFCASMTEARTTCDKASDAICAQHTLELDACRDDPWESFCKYHDKVL